MQDFLDNPGILEDRIARLSDKERELFDFGYVCALLGLLEQITDSKNQLLSKAVITDDEIVGIKLLSRVYVLDAYEDHYARRARTLLSSLDPSVHQL